MATLEKLWTEGTSQLEEKQIPEAKLNAWYLLAEACSISRADYFLYKEKEVDKEKEVRYYDWILKRAAHCPLEYITGKQEFMGLLFHVNENVLIPRQDTEILVEEVLRVSKGKRVLDMCTGSGCIAVSIAKLGKADTVHAVEISRGALETARRNALENEVSISFIESDLFQNVKEQYDIIVSNPPYIESKVIETLMPEVKEFEPRLALDGTEDGLYFYRKITEEARGYLTEKGEIFYEIGYNQGEAVKNIMREAGFSELKIVKDLAGLDRVVHGRMI